MSTTVGFGTYIAGDSVVHNLNTQVKITLACVFSIAVFLVDTWIGLLILVAAVIATYLLSKTPLSKALSGIKPILFILIFTVVVHAFSLSLGNDVAIAQNTGSQAGSLGLTQQFIFFGSFGITLDGLARGLFFALRIALLLAACSLLTFTSSMVEITDAIQSMLAPLRKVKVPVDDIAMMLSIALRFIPTTAQEAQMVVKAQKARGARFEEGNFLSRAKAWVPVFIPLFVRLFHRAEELSEAMDARCYGVCQRGRLHESSLTASSIVVLIAGIIAPVVLGIFL